MAKIKKRKIDGEDYQQSAKIPWVIDTDMIASLLKYSVSRAIKSTDLANLKKFVECLDCDGFRYKPELAMQINAIKWIASARSDRMLKDIGAIKSYVNDMCPQSAPVLEEMDWSDSQLADADVRQIAISIREKLQSYLYLSAKDEIDSLYSKLMNSKFYSIQEYNNKLREVLSRVLVDIQNTAIGNGLIQDFSFSGDNMEDLMKVIVQKAHRPTAVLQTGIRFLNAALSPGFSSGRLYTFLGLTGGFKSGTLLNIADQIRNFNPQVVPVEDGRRKTLLFITMENSVEETIGRLFDMYSDVSDDLSTSTPESVIKTLKEKGGYQFTDHSGIDIDFAYRANLSITTADLYNMVQTLEDNGKDVICLILDYIKRIDSPKESRGDERVRLAYVAQELKSLALFFEIPVITAQQVNREGNSIVDAAMRENKEDVLRFVGSGNIGSCWAIAEESDWIGMINREKQKSSGKMFLTVKRVKLRGKEDAIRVDYFNHPFTNDKNIRLETDVDKPFPVSVRSLATDLVSEPNNDPFENSRRPNVEMPKSAAEKSSAVLKCVGISSLVTPAA